MGRLIIKNFLEIGFMCSRYRLRRRVWNKIIREKLVEGDLRTDFETTIRFAHPPVPVL